MSSGGLRNFLFVATLSLVNDLSQCARRAGTDAVSYTADQFSAACQCTAHIPTLVSTHSVRDDIPPSRSV